MSDLSKIGECVRAHNGLVIANCVHCLTAEELESLTAILGTTQGNGLAGQRSLYIANNIKLFHIDGLGNVKGSLSGPIEISGNLRLIHLDGLVGIAGVGTDYSGLSLKIADNQDLANIDGLRSISEYPGDVVVRENPSLVSLAGLRHVERYGAAFYLEIPSTVQLLGDILRPTTTIDGSRMDILFPDGVPPQLCVPESSGTYSRLLYLVDRYPEIYPCFNESSLWDDGRCEGTCEKRQIFYLIVLVCSQEMEDIDCSDRV